MRKSIILIAAVTLLASGATAKKKELSKVRDITIYRDSTFFSSFPSAVRTADGDLLVAFRHAPNQKLAGEPRNRHVDLNAYLVSVRSSDNGNTWTTEPQLMYAHAFGGSQDPCMIALSDGSILCSSYGWSRTTENIPESNIHPKGVKAGTWRGLGGYLIKSTDNGRTWQGPMYPPPTKGTTARNIYGKLLPAFNRGAMWQAKDGSLLWIVNRNSSNHLLKSPDGGKSWNYMSEVAKCDTIPFNEASVYETPKGDIVGFLRCERKGNPAYIARSKDGGKTFRYESMGFHGVPLTAMPVPDGRVLLVYGYRQAPYGVRARLLNSECTDWATAPEIVLRDDSLSPDCGYPWPVLLDDHHALVTYYITGDDPIQTRYIAGTIVEF